MHDIILQIKKYVPVSWPLQSFIAVNPLFDLTNKPIDEVLLLISNYTNIRGVLCFEEYHQYYREGKISLANLCFAINQFVLDNSISGNQDILTQIISDPKFQLELEVYDKLGQDFSINLIANQAVSYGAVENKVKRQVIDFCNSFFDLGQAKWSMPLHNSNLYLGWREYSIIEDKKFKLLLDDISLDSTQAVSQLLIKLGVPKESWHDYLASITFQILGWASFVKWLESRPDNPYFTQSACFVDLLVIWLAYELLLKSKHKFNYNAQQFKVRGDDLAPLLVKYGLSSAIAKRINVFQLGLIWQRAYEHLYQCNILEQIKTLPQATKTNERVSAQAIFCIDTRSEGFRRYFESLGNYQTYGFAGFFGIGFALKDKHTNNCSLQCPAIVVPNKILVNTPPQSNNVLIKSWLLFVESLKVAKSGFFAPFILFDALGGWLTSVLLGKTFFPAWLKNKFNRLFAKVIDSNKFTNETLNVLDSEHGFTPDELATNIAFVLQAIGLNTNFAKFVIVAGHKAESQNNPYQSSLDCGACGGNDGIPNAIAFCQGANNQQVRQILQDKFSIVIPNDTVFISSCHLTTSDKFEYYNLNILPELQRDEFNHIIADVDNACNLLRLERMAVFDDGSSPFLRKENWAELIPEMALANNATFIVGPRHLTAKLHLHRRAFLHSYEPSLDAEGEILAFILNAPVVVGHWINSQYYFSSTDRDIYGSGNKAIHNIVGGFGVMEGNFSDFRIGLPSQSINYLGDRVHQPLRLLVIIYAKQELVDKVLAKSPNVANIFNGRWAHLVVIEPN